MLRSNRKKTSTGENAELILPGKDGLPTAAAIKAYERDGVVCLKNAFDEAWVAQGRRAVAAAIGTASRSALREDHVESGEKGLFFFDTFLWPRLPSFAKFSFESPAARLAKTVMRSRGLLLYFDMAIVKEPGTSAKTPWHYDEAYWPVSGTQVCNVWMALDDVPEDTALRFVLGSHKMNQNFKGIDFFTKKGMQGQTNPSPPDWDKETQGFEIASAPMKAGDCAILNFRTHHSAPGNLQKRRRPPLSVHTGLAMMPVMPISSGSAIPTSVATTWWTADPLSAQRFPG